MIHLVVHWAKWLGSTLAWCNLYFLYCWRLDKVKSCSCWAGLVVCGEWQFNKHCTSSCNTSASFELTQAEVYWNQTLAMRTPAHWHLQQFVEFHHSLFLVVSRAWSHKLIQPLINAAIEFHLVVNYDYYFTTCSGKYISYSNIFELRWSSEAFCWRGLKMDSSSLHCVSTKLWFYPAVCNQ